MQDYWHHWEDVAIGLLLGLLFAYINYRQHYPGIVSPQAGQAYVTKGEWHVLALLRRRLNDPSCCQFENRSCAACMVLSMFYSWLICT